LKLLLDEMYPRALALTLRTAAIEATTVVEIGLAGGSDPEVFATAVAEGHVLLTENVADFARIASEHVVAGRHHPGVLIALSGRFSRRPDGIGAIALAVRAVADENLEDRLVYLERPPQQDLRAKVSEK
jgi:predicted nuclease of predicted toxin-antitoxin system